MNADYRSIFPRTIIRSDSTAKDEWRTTEGGIVYAVGAGGTITGYGAGKMRPGFGGAIIVDDALKPEDARSPTKRRGVHDWFQGTLESRKNDQKHTPIIVIAQRLHDEDLPGWLLAGGNGEVWEHINIPAIDDAGDSFWPDQFPIEELRRLEVASPYTFAGQYMQSPSPLEGGVFKPARMPVASDLPAIVRRWRGWDLAASDGDGDWTAGVLLGEDERGRLYVLDVRRLRGGPDEVEQFIVDTAHEDGRETVISIAQDPGQAGKVQKTYLGRALRGFRVRFSPETGDKVTRAEPCAAQCNIGNVAMLAGPWNKAFTEELRNFPNGKFDDQVDAFSRAFAQTVKAGSGFRRAKRIGLEKPPIRKRDPETDQPPPERSFEPYRPPAPPSALSPRVEGKEAPRRIDQRERAPEAQQEAKPATVARFVRPLLRRRQADRACPSYRQGRPTERGSRDVRNCARSRPPACRQFQLRGSTVPLIAPET